MTNPPQCGHQECWQAANDAGDGGPVQCLDECEHGWSVDNRKACSECVNERVEAMTDEKREGG